MDCRGMVVVVDTREQIPWGFPATVETRRAALQTGDYSVAGLEAAVAVERKSGEDLVNTLVHERARFADELRRMSRMRYAAVVAECDLGWILRGDYGTLAEPAAVLGSVASICVDWGVPVFLAGGRAEAATLSLALLRRAWLKLGGDRLGARRA